MISVKDMRGIVRVRRHLAAAATGYRPYSLVGRHGTGQRSFLAGDPTQAGRPGVPVVDDGGAGDEVVERAPVALVRRSRETRCPRVRNRVIPSPTVRRTAWRPLIGAPCVVTTCSPRIAMPSVFPLDGPLVGEVEELPKRQHDEGGQLVVGQGEGVSGHQLERGIEQQRRPSV